MEREELITQIALLESEIWDSNNMEIMDIWDEYTADLFHQECATYWGDIDDESTLSCAYDYATDLINKIIQ